MEPAARMRCDERRRNGDRFESPIHLTTSLANVWTAVANLYDAAVNVLRSVWWTATRRAHQPHRR